MGGDDYAARRGSARLPMEAPVRIRFPGVDDPYDGTVGDIGMAGMFIACSAPMPAGTLMHFEFRPSPQWHRLRGRARIVWARQEPTAGGEPPGMGVRFIELDERGRRGVRWLIETYQSVGDKPFATWSVPSQFTRKVAPEGDHLATQEIVPIPPAETEPPAWLRKPWPLLAAALVAVVLVSSWAFLMGDDSSTNGESTPAEEPQIADVGIRPAVEDPVENPVGKATRSAGEAAPQGVEDFTGAATTPSTGPAAGEGIGPLPARPEAGPIEDDVAPARPTERDGTATSADAAPTISAILTDLLNEWAAAWSSQDVDRYLAFYAPEFTPEAGMSRNAWARQRADRLARPEFIRVGIDDIQVLDEGSATPRVVFSQSYESNTFSDQVTKALTWTRSEGSWRIVSERAAP